MNYLVSAQRGRLPEPFPTDLADKGPGPSVHWHVAGQVVVGVENLATVGAGVGLVLALHHGLNLGLEAEAWSGGARSKGAAVRGRPGEGGEGKARGGLGEFLRGGGGHEGGVGGEQVGSPGGGGGSKHCVVPARHGVDYIVSYQEIERKG